MHLVYIVRPGQNEELRYSLRSAAENLPVESVTIVGDAPGWVTGVRRIPGNRYGRDKPRNVLDNVRILAAAGDLPDDVVVMNDDFYVLTPLTTIPVLYRGPLTRHIAECATPSWWSLSLQRTLAWLQAQGHPAPLSYDLHVPLPISRERMREALDRLGDAFADNPPQWRTVYGNLAAVGGIQHRDQKVSVPTRQLPGGPFVSTDDGAFYVGLQSTLRGRFPHPSQFEARKRSTRKDTPVALYQNVTTKMIVEDNSGRLDGIARWRKLSDADVAALAPADPNPDAATAEAADAAVSDDGAKDAPEAQGDADDAAAGDTAADEAATLAALNAEADGEPDLPEAEPEKPRRRTKKAD